MDDYNDELSEELIDLLVKEDDSFDDFDLLDKRTRLTQAQIDELDRKELFYDNEDE